MFHAHGPDWYERHFSDRADGQLRLDATPTYVWSPLVPERIFQDNPNAKMIVCLRNPIDRAFSHFWHLKKKGLINYDFDDVLSSYDVFSTWLEPGLFGRNLEKYVELFSRGQIFLLDFDELSNEPERMLSEVFRFFGVDPTVKPSLLHQRVNVAGPRYTLVHRAVDKAWRSVSKKARDGEISRARARLTGRSIYSEGVPNELRARLIEVCYPEIERLAKVTGWNLDHWCQPQVPPSGPSA
jgi:hypothetical protein